MLFMVLERFKNRDAKAIHLKLDELLRGVKGARTYAGSEENLAEVADDPRLFQQWVMQWHDLIEFEIIPVVPSAETRDAIAPQL